MHFPHSIRPLSSSSPIRALLGAAVLAALAVEGAAQTQFEALARRRLPVSNAGANSIALGDVDGDGDLDMIIGTGGQNRLYLNDGTGAFTDVTATHMPVDNDSTWSVVLGDADGDGDLDLVIGNGDWPAGQQNRLYLNDGTGTFTDATASRMPVDHAPTWSVALGDVDRDGDLDIVIGNDTQQNRLYLNDGTGTFSDSTAGRMPGDTSRSVSVALGDMDGDGDLDMVIGNSGWWNGGQQNRLYLNDGTGTFTDATAGRMPGDNDYTDSVVRGDVDGDGDLDLVIGNGNSGQNRLYLNDGTGAFSDATASRMPPVGNGETTSVALGDLDGDGDLDLVIGNAVQQQNRLYVNDGTGTFTDATANRMPNDNDGTIAVALGDVDGDGDLDVVIGNDRQQNRLLFNLQRQFHAPVALQVGQSYTLDAYLRYVQPSPITFALPYLSFRPAAIALPPFGTIGIDPAQAIALPPIPIPQPAGVGSLKLLVANDPGLIGTRIYSQALIVPYPWQARLSNVASDVMQ